MRYSMWFIGGYYQQQLVSLKQLDRLSWCWAGLPEFVGEGATKHRQSNSIGASRGGAPWPWQNSYQILQALATGASSGAAKYTSGFCQGLWWWSWREGSPTRCQHWRKSTLAYYVKMASKHGYPMAVDGGSVENPRYELVAWVVPS